MTKNPQKTITIQDLYPDLSPEEQEVAEYNLKRYVGAVWSIFSRLKAEGRLEEVLEELRQKRNKRKNLN